MKILDKEINNFKDIEEFVYEELHYSDRWIDEYGSLPSVDDVDDLHDLLTSLIDEEDYDEFCNLLESERENFCGIDIDTEGPHDAAMAVWMSTRI